MAYLCLADDCLQVRSGLQIIGVRAAHKRLDRRLADGPAEKQLDHSALGHSPNAGQYVDQLVISVVGSGQVNVMHVPPESFFALLRQPVQYGLSVFGITAIFS